MLIHRGCKAPWFFSVGYQEDNLLNISLADYSSAGQWLLLFFYPLEFGYFFSGDLPELEARW